MTEYDESYEARFFESLVFDDLEQLGIFYDTSHVWREYLSLDHVLEFLSFRYGTGVRDFPSLRELNPKEVDSVPEEDYYYENDLQVDPWSVVLLLRENSEESIGKLLELEEIVSVKGFYADVWSFVVGMKGEVGLTEFLWLLFEGKDSSESEDDLLPHWGPVAVGAACGGNVKLLSYLYEDLLSEEYFDTSEYYCRWTRTALETAIGVHQDAAIEYLEKL